MGVHHKLVFVRYYFEGAEEHSIRLTLHGNSKAGCAIPYLRTYKSTVSKMKNNVGGNRSGLKRVVQEIGRRSWRTRAQQFCWTVTAEWEAIEVPEGRVSAAKGGGPHFSRSQKKWNGNPKKGDKFTRGYSLDDNSQKFVLFTDEQLDDIANFCCNDIDGHKSILYVDVTFQLGPFFVLLTSYRNTAL